MNPLCQPPADWAGAMMSYMDAAQAGKRHVCSGIQDAVAVLYPAYICRASLCVAPMNSAEESLI
jgi:hypothetical protein